ncbi:MAG: hypothetical protein JXQ75_09920, partial [Phycisphaerae bacterium]|nr:hypothetical protein [Phycisphaerae bacterium]
MRAHVLILMESETLNGPARNLLDSAERLRKDVRFSFATFERGDQQTSDFIEAIRARDFDVHVLREAFRYDLRAAFALGALIRSLNPDVLQIHNTKSRLYAYLLRRAGRVREIPQVDFF